MIGGNTRINLFVYEFGSLTQFCRATHNHVRFYYIFDRAHYGQYFALRRDSSTYKPRFVRTLGFFTHVKSTLISPQSCFTSRHYIDLRSQPVLHSSLNEVTLAAKQVVEVLKLFKTRDQEVKEHAKATAAYQKAKASYMWW